MDLIEQQVGTNHDDISQQLAGLIAFGRREHPMDPAKGAFKRYWNLIQNCRVVFGKFPETGPTNEALFDKRGSEGPTLYVADDTDRGDLDLIRLSWRVVGPGYRDAFEAYAGVLRTDGGGEFLRERGIGDAEWDEIQTAIGASLEESSSRLRPIALAFWLRGHPGGAISEFQLVWDASGEPVARVSRFFDVDESAARTLLNDARSVINDEEEGRLAECAGVTVAEWQWARDQLGLGRVRFGESIRNFEKVVRWVSSAVSVAASRYVRLDADLVKSTVDSIHSLDCPPALAESRQNEQAVLVEALRCAAEVVEKVPQHAMTLLAGALKREALHVPETVHELRLRGVPRRELFHVVDHNEPERIKIAKEAVQSVLQVAKVLAGQHEEALELTAVENDLRVLHHTTGWWANAFAALRALKRAIVRQAPQTARMLARKRVFATLLTRHELCEAFPELSDLKSETTRALLPKKRILGLEKTSSEIEADLVPGGNGEIERGLRQWVRPELDLYALARRERAQLEPNSNIRGLGGTGGGGVTRRRDEDELAGYLGELFFYNYCIAADFPDFHISCWVSENRGKYEGQTPELTGLGCDFRYRDVAGRLTQRNDSPLCFIDVKATTGDGWTPFQITANEWRVAQECHDEPDERVYIIVRIRDVQEKPEIFDVIVDPIRAFLDGWLQQRNKDFYLVVGHPTE